MPVQNSSAAGPPGSRFSRFPTRCRSGTPAATARSTPFAGRRWVPVRVQTSPDAERHEALSIASGSAIGFPSSVTASLPATSPPPPSPDDPGAASELSRGCVACRSCPPSRSASPAPRSWRYLSAAPVLTSSRTSGRVRGAGAGHTAPGQLRGGSWHATAVQAPGESEQHLAPARGAPARIAVLGVGALGDDAVALAPAHQSAHAGSPADPGDETHGVHCASVEHTHQSHQAREVEQASFLPRRRAVSPGREVWVGAVRVDLASHRPQLGEQGGGLMVAEVLDPRRAGRRSVRCRRRRRRPRLPVASCATVPRTDDDAGGPPHPMATAAQWLEGARPRTLPAAVAPVAPAPAPPGPAGRRPARAARAARLARAAGRRQLRQRLLATASAARTTTASGRSGSSGPGATRRRGAARRVRRVRRRRGRRARARRAQRRLVAARGRRRLRRRRLVLHRRPRPYGYAGLGEVFVFVFFGLVAVLGTTYTQAGRVTGDAVRGRGRLSGCIACALLVVNNLRDVTTDAVAGKRTLAVRLGAGDPAALRRDARWRASPLWCVAAVQRPVALVALLAALPAVRARCGRCSAARRPRRCCRCCGTPAGWSWPTACCSASGSRSPDRVRPGSSQQPSGHRPHSSRQHRPTRPWDQADRTKDRRPR